MLAVSVISPVAFLGAPSPSEMLMLAVIALLVFGKDLPNVAKQWGKTFNEFRRHLNGMRSELNDVIYAEPERPKLQYHPEFQKRDPLPEAIAAEGTGDLAATVKGNDAASNGSAMNGNGDGVAPIPDNVAAKLPAN